ncbi:MAG: cohesin domain-containing protein [Candidatus Bathyarchaeia archaeon]
MKNTLAKVIHMFATIAIVAMLTGLVALIQPSTMQAQAATTSASVPYFSVEPFLYQATSVSQTFTVSIVAHNIDPASNAVGFEFNLGYDPTLLSVVAVNNGTFLNGPAAPPNGGVLYYGPNYGSNRIGPNYGSNYVNFAGFILPDDSGVWHPPLLNGTGTVATVTFRVIYKPSDGSGASCELQLYDTKLGDSGAKAITHKDISGFYAIGPFLAAEPSLYQATSVSQTFTVSIVAHNIDPANNVVGFEFTLGYDPTLLSVVAVNNGTFLNGPAAPPNGGVLYYGPNYGSNYVNFAGFILPDDSGVWHPPLLNGTGTVATVTFQVISTPPKGQVASSDLTLYDVEIADTSARALSRSGISGSVDISVPTGDLNGDHVVNILDAVILANAFGSSPGAANWNALADLNHDNTINILDSILLANNFGQTV